MLNLEKLEEKLDRALENECQESLTNWLFKKREKSYMALLGIGSMENKKEIKCEYLMPSEDVFLENEGNDFPIINTYYLMAA
ncbi:MAG: hypothetical protein H6573_05455 [Lewinellaceae bacterium]|nr:hypothetical protein [Lewinellaceae bacterium]